jgi:hypothetical protein
MHNTSEYTPPHHTTKQRIGYDGIGEINNQMTSYPAVNASSTPWLAGGWLVTDLGSPE